MYLHLEWVGVEDDVTHAFGHCLVSQDTAYGIRIGYVDYILILSTRYIICIRTLSEGWCKVVKGPYTVTSRSPNQTCRPGAQTALAR